MKPIIKQVKEIQFGLFSPENIKKYAVCKIVTPELYDMDGYPVDGGLMDLKLGVINPGVRCRTCGNDLKSCLGHFGFIELARPVFHIKFIPLIELCLKSTCQKCGKILLTEEDIKNKKISKAKTVKKCPHCKAEQEKIKLEKPSSVYMGKRRIFATEVREILSKISDEDLKVLGINIKTCRPEWAILTLLLVPPVTVRPSITLETGERSEDDLTHKLSDIVRSNQRLWENLNAGAPEVIIEDLWDLLQYHITTFFDNNISNIPPARHRSGQPLKTITERIKGKEGRIRHNLAGKRVNYSSRTVISPDPFINLNEVGIPYEIAKVLTVPERVTTNNLEMLKDLLKKEDYPNAPGILRPDGKKKRITEETREQLIEEVTEGYSVERTLRNGDVVLFNRHPSLHRMSLMSHQAKVLPGRTFRIHPAVTFPYNADFDGDEMNVHAPQTEEARVEAGILMDVSKNLISPKVNANVFGCIEDSVTGLYLLTAQEKISKAIATQLLVLAGVDEDKLASLKENLSGKEIFSLLLPNVNFEAKTKSCKGKDCPHYNNCKKENCPNQSYISIKNGKLISGIIDEKIIGVETNALIRDMDKQVGRKETMIFLRKAFLLGILYLTKYGLTLSLQDIKISKEVKEETAKVIKDSEKKTEEIIESYYDKSLEIIPGKSAEESREIKIMQTLNEVRTKVGVIAKKGLDKDNPAYLMTICGAKGNLLQLTQMSCVVGQQSLWGKRINIGYHNRTLPFYKPNELSPKSGGFVDNSFLGGLNPDEFFFTAITGRDSLMDTALRTPKSGYLYRRLANALQDIRVEYDGTVRDSNSQVIQFLYGDDGIDVSKEHLENGKVCPGEAVGLITAQSFGESSTQMVLNVFHFAGVSEMQVNLGLPRLIEIFDARKNPSTPSMEIYLEKEENNEEGARKLATKIKEVKLVDVTKEISIDFVNKKIKIKLDKEFLKEFHLNSEKISEVLSQAEVNVKRDEEILTITPKIKEEDFKKLYKLKEKIKQTIISGVKGIVQVLPVKKENGEYVILTAGSNLEEVLKIKHVNPDKTTTNNIHEVANVFGIEAARQTIIIEVKKVLEKQGLDISEKHTKLISDAMTVNGKVKGVTRIGIIEDKSSILARASFETPIKHFVNAAINGSKDHLVSVVENLILNQPVPIGTGLPGLIVKLAGDDAINTFASKKDTEKEEKTKKPKSK